MVQTPTYPKLPLIFRSGGPWQDLVSPVRLGSLTISGGGDQKTLLSTGAKTLVAPGKCPTLLVMEVSSCPVVSL